MFTMVLKKIDDTSVDVTLTVTTIGKNKYRFSFDSDWGFFYYILE